jgi:inner membrane protein
MDSLTQIVLGAAVGEAVLGKKVGHKAALWGAIAGTIPDLDVLATHVVDIVTATAWHRGFSHSLLFSMIMAPVLGALVWRLYAKKEASWQQWSWLFFWGLFTHPLLDAFTTWGTQLFWPLDLRLAFQSIFVIDPLYTLPFLFCLMAALRLERTHPKRSTYIFWGLSWSTAYLMLSLVLKGMAHHRFEEALKDQGIPYKAMDNRPAPLNTILWMANVETKTQFLLGEYSFFDSRPITFRSIPKDHHLLGPLAQDEKVKKLIEITEGWYAITKKKSTLYFNDLRFGLLNMDADDEKQFAFSYELLSSPTGLKVKEVPKSRTDAKKVMGALWKRMWGN